jgi:hypothetical protein
MRSFLVAAAVTTVAGAIACGGNPAAPSPPAASTQTSGLRIAGNPVVDLTLNETRPLQIEERDSAGALVTRAASDYTYESSDSAVIAVGADGLLRALATGGAVITVRSPSGLASTVHAWVQLPEQIASTYRITLLFGDGIPPGWRDVFQQAAEHYQRVIRAALPAAQLTGKPGPLCSGLPDNPPASLFSGTETGTRIWVGRRDTPDRPMGGVCSQRPMPRPTVTVGWVSIGRDSNPDPVRITFLLALHEMGHALGLVGTSTGAQVPWVDRAAGQYTGPFAIEGYRRQTGSLLAFLPTEGGHWKFPGDVMSATTPAQLITRASVGALMDLGYPAAWYGAAQ